MSLTKSILLILILGSALTAISSQQQKNPPNIIIIMADDLGYGDLSSYGSEIPTPNIDRIGKNGIRFTDFYVAAPVCTPSRYSLMTGSYPQRSMHELTNVIMPGDSFRYMDKSETTIAQYLKKANYNTALIGKWHLGLETDSSLPSDFGFDSFYGFTGGAVDYFYHAYAKDKMDWYVNNKLKKEEGYVTDLLTGHAISYIENVRKNTKPFFLYLPYNAPHYGKTDTTLLKEGYTIAVGEAKAAGQNVINSLQVPRKYLDRFQHIKDPHRRAYAAMVSNLDDNVGKLMMKLEQDGLLENTMIWFISDNGGYSQTQKGHASNGALRGEKASVYEGGIRVPAMVSWKGHIKSGQISSQPMVNADLVPTIASITNTQKYLRKGKIDGKDMSATIFDNKTFEREIFWKYNLQSALRSGKWKLVNGKELYDLSADISERKNLAVQFPDRVKELQQKFSIIEKSLTPDKKQTP